MTLSSGSHVRSEGKRGVEDYCKVFGIVIEVGKTKSTVFLGRKIKNLVLDMLHLKRLIELFFFIDILELFGILTISLL